MRELRFLFPFLKKYWHTGLLAVFFLVAEVVIDLYQPRMMATIVNNGILGLSNGGRPDLNLVISTGWKMLGLVLVCGICGLLSAVFTNITAQGSTNDIRKLSFERIMHFSFDQTDDFSAELTVHFTRFPKRVRISFRGGDILFQVAAEQPGLVFIE